MKMFAAMSSLEAAHSPALLVQMEAHRLGVVGLMDGQGLLGQADQLGILGVQWDRKME